MAIVIDTELFLKNTEPFRKIGWLDALPAGKLPREYLDSYDKPWVYMDTYQIGEKQKRRLWIKDPHGGIETLVQGEVYSEKEFQRKIQLISWAGDRLKRIREKNQQRYQDKVGFHSYYI
jgi:hypothetical protein